MSTGIIHIEFDEFKKKCKRIGVPFPEEEARRLLAEGNTAELRRMRLETRRL